MPIFNNTTDQQYNVQEACIKMTLKKDIRKLKNKVHVKSHQAKLYKKLYSRLARRVDIIFWIYEELVEFNLK